MSGSASSASADSLRPRLDLVDSGIVAYATALAMQETLASQRWDNQVPDSLLLLEHPPVITLGRRASAEDLYVSPQQLADEEISLVTTERGGLATYHGPGQLVGYPIVRLRGLPRSLPDYIHGLEEVIIASLARIRVLAFRHPEHVGVWTEKGKIAAIGVAVRHGVSLHGFAVNLQPRMSHFSYLNPCGIGHLGVVSAAQMLGHEVDMQQFKQLVVEAFCSEFQKSPRVLLAQELLTGEEKATTLSGRDQEHLSLIQ